MSDTILVLNCGSSSITFALFDACVDVLPREPLFDAGVLLHLLQIEEMGVGQLARLLYRESGLLVRQQAHCTP